MAQRLDKADKCELRLNGRATEDLSDRFSLVQTESTAYPSLLSTERTNNFGNGGQFFRKQRQVFYAIERADDQIIECDT